MIFHHFCNSCGNSLSQNMSILGSRPSRSSDVTTVPDGCQIPKLIDFHGFWSKSIDFWWISIIIYAPKWFELLNLLYSMFINSNHLLLVWTFCCEIDDFWWNSMKSHQFLNLTAVWHRGNVGRPRRARTQNWHIQWCSKLTSTRYLSSGLLLWLPKVWFVHIYKHF